jgi:transketolase
VTEFVSGVAPPPAAQYIPRCGVVLGIERFGASAPYQRIYQELGLTVENVVAKAKELLNG